VRFQLRVESSIVIAFIICVFLSFYFVYLSFQTAEDALKKQFVALAVYSLVAGVAILACITLYFGIKRIFRFEQLRKRQTEQD
jgi:TRAP-type C4-dicarboxylate transport system permease small subunit